MERLDKLLAATGRWSRREVKDLVRQGRVELDGQPAAAADVKIDPAATDIRVDGEALSYSRFTYLMLNKPAGVLSAARDSRQKTVLDLYGELVAASDAKESLLCGTHAVYACCPQLWDKKLQEALGCQDDPMRVLDELFDLAELDLLGGQALRFLGLIPEPPAKKPETEQTEGDGESKGDPGLETVKN